MSKNLVIAAVAVVILAVLGGFWYLNSRNNSTAPATVEEKVGVSSEPSPQSTESGQTGGVKEFTIKGSSFKYEPNELKVNKGDKVKITFEDEGGTHDFTINEFGVQSKRINTGGKETLEFVANKSGSFSYYCSVPGHRASGMVGTLIVE